jgi:precorrin-4/cobalt-precorrin-4 C11-methyltransferase
VACLHCRGWPRGSGADYPAGAKVLAEADVVFYTGSLVPEGVLAHCRPGVEAIDTRSFTLETLLPQIVERVKAGRRVVRLQDGDPSFTALYTSC